MAIVFDLESPMIVPHLRGKQKVEILTELAEHLADLQEDLDASELLRVLAAREAQGSTALDGGLAIPHAKLQGLPGLLACLGRSLKGVDFGAPDGGRSHFFFVVLAPADTPGAHLKLLAKVSQIFRDPDVRHRLLKARTGGDMRHILAHADAH